MRKPTAKSETDWKRVRHESAADAPIPHDPSDGPYDPNDSQATERYLYSTAIVRRRGQRGPQKAPTKQKVSLRLSPEIVRHFRKTGPGWQARINDALLKVVKKRA
jgi:uncharacterized protein (DUF4415 family)